MIGISSVLNEINQPLRGAQAFEFSLEFIRLTDGKSGRRGESKSLARVQKYSKPGSKKEKKGRGIGFNLKSSSTLLLKDMSTGEPISVKIWSIIKFNGQKVQH